MKKYIISGIAVLAIAAVAAWNVSMNSQKNGLSDISLANLEALAWGEVNWLCPNPDKPEPKREKLLPNITPILQVRY
jgi:hypothetical protein